VSTRVSTCWHYDRIHARHPLDARVCGANCRCGTAICTSTARSLDTHHHRSRTSAVARRLPHGNLSVVYDELGNKYDIPSYCLSNPVNLVKADSVAPPATTPDETDEPTTQPPADSPPVVRASVSPSPPFFRSQLPCLFTRIRIRAVSMYLHPSVCVCTYKCMCICVCACIYICLSAHVHVYTYI